MDGLSESRGEHPIPRLNFDRLDYNTHLVLFVHPGEPTYAGTSVRLRIIKKDEPTGDRKVRVALETIRDPIKRGLLVKHAFAQRDDPVEETYGQAFMTTGSKNVLIDGDNEFGEWTK